jgi:hypothetical protein
VRRFWVLYLIIAVAFALRVHRLGDQELRGDEGFSWNYIQGAPGEILARIIREGDPQPPIHYWLLWGWATLTGDSEFAMRAWSAFSSLMLVPLMYQTGRQLWREEVGLLAAGLTAIHPQQIWLAQDVRNMYQLALIALLAGTLLVRRFHHEDTKARRHTKTFFNWPGYVACGALAMYSHYYALFPLMAHGAYALWPRLGWRRSALLWVIAGSVIALLVAPWALVILPVYSRGQLADPGALPFTTYASAVIGDLAAGPAFSDSTKLLVAAAFVGLSLIPIFNRSSSSPHLLIYLFTSLLLPFFGIYAVVALRSTFNSFYFVFAFPAAYLLAAGGVHWLFQKYWPASLALIAIGVITFGIGLNNHYNNPQYSKTRGMRQVAAHLAEAAQPGDVYLANFPDPAQVYYLHHLGLSYHMEPGSIDFDPAQVNAALDELLADRVWFVPVNAAQLDPNAYVQNRLLDTAILLEDHHFNKMRLMLFVSPSEAQPLSARFADGIGLIGYHLGPNRLTLIWKAYARPSADYTLFVHADADDGFTVGGHDAPPRLPTSRWEPGQTIVDVHEFDIPTDQPITLVAGLYLPATGQRLKLETAGTPGTPPEPDAATITSTTP